MKIKKILLIRKHFFDPKITPGVLMFKILLFCCGFFFIAPFALQSQSFIPLVGENKSWNCAYEEFDWQESYTIRLEGDTLINGIEHKKIMREMHFYTWIEVTGYIREDSLGRVYALNTSFEEGLLYDFSAYQGDTIVLHNTIKDSWDYDCPWYAELTIVVDTVYTIETQDGITRKVLAIQSTEDNFTELWIEGIGSLAGVTKSGTNIFEELSCTSSFITNYLMCYFEDDSLVYYHSPYEQTHDCRHYDDTNLEEATRNPIQIKILPNPVSGSFFHVECSEPFQGDILMYNTLGNIVYKNITCAPETKIKVMPGSLPAGIYFLQLYNKNRIFVNAKKILVN